MATDSRPSQRVYLTAAYNFQVKGQPSSVTYRRL